MEQQAAEQSTEQSRRDMLNTAAAALLETMSKADPEFLNKLRTKSLHFDSERRLNLIEQRLGIKRTSKSMADQPKLEPDMHWSFKAMPKDTDTVRILDEADAAGARAVGATICGHNWVAVRWCDLEKAAGKMRTTADSPFWLVGGIGPQKVRANRDWVIWYVGGDPVAMARKMLADLDAWANKKHRTTVSIWR